MAELIVVQMAIDSVEVPAPKSFTYKPEKVWSNNTGRTASGKMVGTIKCIKRTLSITWGYLTEAQKQLIEGQVSDVEKPFVILWMRLSDGSTMEMECYFGTPQFEAYERVGGIWRYKSGKVDGIER